MSLEIVNHMDQQVILKYNLKLINKIISHIQKLNSNINILIITISIILVILIIILLITII